MKYSSKIRKKFEHKLEEFEFKKLLNSHFEKDMIKTNKIDF